ncbi:universal stress protein [Streptomyces sp. NPDC020817]|uniref:universal stress protein n=1 Tax=Streptomyces sp. NPDC020817 TaxID=3365095 RepID=UPI00379A5C17
MSRTVIAGIDGSPASLAAAEWAAREARRRRLPLKRAAWSTAARPPGSSTTPSTRRPYAGPHCA